MTSDYPPIPSTHSPPGSHASAAASVAPSHVVLMRGVAVRFLATTDVLDRSKAQADSSSLDVVISGVRSRSLRAVHIEVRQLVRLTR